MGDPLGLIGTQGGQPLTPRPTQGGVRPDANGPAFRDVLLENLSQVNKLQQDAEMAIEDLQAGRRDDLEGVILATEKADVAFQMLQQMRNRVAEAYDEIKQIRV